MPYKNLKFSDTPNQSSKPIRILHVVGGMDRGGVETWLMHVLRQIDRDRYQMDFLAPANIHYAYTDEIKALGSQIFPCIEPSRLLLYAANFQSILQDQGPYDIIHVHVHLFSGYVLYLAKQAGIKIRVIHSHSDTSSVESAAKLPRRIYNRLMKYSISKNMTAGLAASRLAAADLLSTDSNWKTLYCGIDLTSFDNQINNRQIRIEFGIPEDALVIGHVGRFDSPKNHFFLLEIAAEIVKVEPKMRLVLIGTGALKTEIESKIIELNLTAQVILLGARNDVPRLMQGLMDIFLFPSLYEGLGLVLVEAQAAGLPCIFSDVVPEEADIVQSLTQRISLTKSATEWAKVVLDTSTTNNTIPRDQALELVKQSAFNIQVSLPELTRFYDEAANSCVKC
jgi:glycosyltransferase involved in cell wall biosynthesis